jgi:hypothetical protein
MIDLYTFAIFARVQPEFICLWHFGQQTGGILMLVIGKRISPDHALSIMRNAHGDTDGPLFREEGKTIAPWKRMENDVPVGAL